MDATQLLIFPISTHSYPVSFLSLLSLFHSLSLSLFSVSFCLYVCDSLSSLSPFHIFFISYSLNSNCAHCPSAVLEEPTLQSASRTTNPRMLSESEGAGRALGSHRFIGVNAGAFFRKGPGGRNLGKKSGLSTGLGGACV